jgi:guanylate kinase
MANLGTLYTVSAPSGAGKTSLVSALVKSTRKCVFLFPILPVLCARARWME